MAPSPTEVDALLDRLLEQNGLVDYVRGFAPGDPLTWGDEQWDALRRRLWRDCYDGERYYWQPLTPTLRALYERQARA